MARKNRLGISALSKSNWKDAWDEELLMNKETGEILMKSINGDVLSYEYMTRLNNHIDAFSDKINDMGYKGIMSMVINEDNVLPVKIDFGTNILDEPILLGSDLKYVMISLSSDTIIPIDITPRLEQIPFTYNIELRDVDNQQIANYSYTVGYDESLSKVRNIESFNIEYDKAYLTSIYLDPGTDIVYEKPPVNIVHSILVFLGGGES